MTRRTDRKPARLQPHVGQAGARVHGAADPHAAPVLAPGCRITVAPRPPAHRYEVHPGEPMIGGFATMGPGKYLPEGSEWARQVARR